MARTTTPALLSLLVLLTLWAPVAGAQRATPPKSAPAKQAPPTAAATKVAPTEKGQLARLRRRLCFAVETDWIDPLPVTAPAAEGGDFWRLNENRPPSGARVRVRPARVLAVNQGEVHNLDNAGCFSFVPPADRYRVTISSTGKVNGINIVSYTDWEDQGSGPVLTGDFRLARKSWILSGGAGLVPRTLVLEAADRSNSIAWHAYALMAYAMTRSTYNLGDFGNSRNCGASNTPCCGHSAWDEVDPVTLYSNTMRPGTGFSSTWKHDDDIDSDDNSVRVSGYDDLFDRTGSVPSLGSGLLDKWQMAHELGHVIVMQRMGARTETNYAAALYGCMGQYSGGNLTKPSDTDDKKNKAPLSREFSSGAAREGWAHFFAAQLYNDVEESDCWYDSAHYMDLDLDGDIDNDYPNSTYKDGVFTCEGAGLEPLLGEPDASDPLASWIHARDWLAEVWNNSPNCGSSTSASQITGRSSQYDWMRYFWDMATDEDVSVETLTDIYVDMCPTEWVAGPPNATPNDNWPELRLERSVTFHGALAAHNQQKSNGVDHR